MAFNTKGHDIFRRWYVDGRMYYQKIIDRDATYKGITELRYIDPRKIKKIREVRKKRPDGPTPYGLSVIDEFEEYFLFNEKGVTNSTSGGIKIATDAIAFVHHQDLSTKTKIKVLSYLHKAIKPVNQLRMIEDAAVIYRIARAPERRIFKIDVGNLPKVKAEQYLRDVMARYRNKLVYDAAQEKSETTETICLCWKISGYQVEKVVEVQDRTHYLVVKILGEIGDLEYFQKKLYRALNVPVSRLEASQGFNMGRVQKLLETKLKFTKFVQRLRNKFTELFNDILKTQLILKAVIAEDDWHVIREHLQYDFLQDGYFAELKQSEILRERIQLANEMQGYIGKFYSVEYLRKNVLKQNEREMEDIDRQIKKEVKDGIIDSPQGQIQNDEEL